MITETRFVYFRHILENNGTINAESFFKIRSNAKNAQDAANEAAQWAGEIGSPLKIGGGGQNVFQLHPDFLISKVEIRTNTNEFVFDIMLYGTAANKTWQLLPESEYTENDGIITKKLKYIFCGENHPDFPHEGEIINDPESGKQLVCIASSIVENGKNRKKLSLTFRSFADLPDEPDVSTNFIEKIYYTQNENTMRCIAEAYWSKETYSSAIAALHFFDESHPALWAGSNFVLEKMESVPDGNYGFKIKLTALKIETRLICTNCIDNENGKSIEAVYEVRKSESNSFDDLTGTVPFFAGSDFIITAVSKKDLNNALMQITVKACERKNMTRIGEIKSFVNRNGTSGRKAEFFITAEEAENFRSSLQIAAPAEWAGDDYYLQSFTEKEKADGFFFELEAAEIKTRMLTMSQNEKFSGFDLKGTPRREVIYKSVWQVAADDFKNFTDISGQNASWSNDDAVITKVTPEKISEAEYEITIEAQRRSNPGLYTLYSFGDYENLSSKVELDCKLIDFRLSPKDCGYFLNSDGMHEVLAGWQPGSECPFVAKNVLHPRFINLILKILRISETTYCKGNMNRAIPEMTEWISTRVFNGKVGKYQGSYLKSDLQSKEIYDNHGNIWTKITRVYDLAPDGAEWNQYYFQRIR